jgi:hypothetical protein
MEWNSILIQFFPYEQKSKVQYSIEVFLNITATKLQERIELEFYQTTRPYPIIMK